MRDIAFAAIMAVLVPLSFLQPWIGILAFSWLGYMNPHQQCYGFARWLVPWGELVAVATLSGFVLTKDRKPFIWCRETFLMILLWFWFAVTTQFSWYPDDAWPHLERFSKIILMVLLTIPLIQDRARLRWLLLVIAGSLGFYGFKAGFFVMATGGNYMVLGAPGETFVSTNNTIALALNMCLPLFWFLRKDEPRRWLRSVLLATFWLSVLAIPFTYSRGGMLGLAFVLLILFVARSKRWYLALPAVGLAALLLFTLAPDKWVERMQTIETYDQDQSAMSRLQAWQMAIKIANDHPLFGGGFWAFNHPETYTRYSPELGRRATDAHSIYFNLLGEHGYVGLGLYVTLVGCTVANLISMYRVGRQYKELSWISDYSYMLGTAIAAYLLNGTFLSVAYFDLAWQLFALVVVLKELTKRELKALAPVRAGAPAMAFGLRLGKTAPALAGYPYRVLNGVAASSAKPT